MKFKKTLACVAAAALAVSSLAVSSFAVTANDKGEWEFSPDDLALLAESTTTITVEYNSPNGWEDVGLGVSLADGTWISAAFACDKGEGTATFTVKDFLAKAGVETVEGATYAKVEGYNSTVISSVTVEAGEPTVGPSEEPVEPADVAIKNGGTMSIEENKEMGKNLLRINIYNKWTGKEESMIVDPEDFVGATSISVKFSVSGVTEPFNAWLALTSNNWGNVLNQGAEVPADAITIDKDGVYVYTLPTTAITGEGDFFLALYTDLAFESTDISAEANVPYIQVLDMAVNTELEVTEDDKVVTPPADEDNNNTSDEPTKEPTEGENSGKPGDNVDTGVTLAVVPAALAAAALAAAGIATKKRK